MKSNTKENVKKVYVRVFAMYLSFLVTARFARNTGHRTGKNVTTETSFEVPCNFASGTVDKLVDNTNVSGFVMVCHVDVMP